MGLGGCDGAGPDLGRCSTDRLRSHRRRYWRNRRRWCNRGLRNGPSTVGTSARKRDFWATRPDLTRSSVAGPPQSQTFEFDPRPGRGMQDAGGCSAADTVSESPRLGLGSRSRMHRPNQRSGDIKRMAAQRGSREVAPLVTDTWRSVELDGPRPLEKAASQI